MVAKLELTFPVLSDPGGGLMLRPLGLWRNERDEPKPATLVLAGSDNVVVRQMARHDSDRPEPTALLDLTRPWARTMVKNGSNEGER